MFTCNGGMVHFVAKDTVKGNDNLLIGSMGKIIGNGNSVKGDQNTIIGNGNSVKGDNLCIIGNGNIIKGDQIRVRGNSNDVYSHDGLSSIIGNNNTLNGSLVYGSKKRVNNEPTKFFGGKYQFNGQFNGVNISGNSNINNSFNTNTNIVNARCGTQSLKQNTFITIIDGDIVENDNTPYLLYEKAVHTNNIKENNFGKKERKIECDEVIDETDKEPCVICFERKRKCAARPCNHLRFCNTCCVELEKKSPMICPVCNQPVESFESFF